jgi:hypothetical protein
MEPLDSVPYSKQTDSGPYPEPDESNPHSHTASLRGDGT